jgi:hypothetical protein
MSDSQISERKRLANQRNAQKSTGPRTIEGKKRSSQNAITHGLFTRDTVVEGEDKAEFKMLRRDFINVLKPQDYLELSFVDDIVNTRWKLIRYQRAEFERYVAAEADNIKTLRQTYIDQMGSPRLAEPVFEQEKKEYLESGRERAAMAMAVLLDQKWKRLERLADYEQRMQRMISRSMRELQQLRKNRLEFDGLPDSPFLEEEEKETADETNPTPSPGTPGEGGGEGSSSNSDAAPEDGQSPHPTLSRSTGRGDEVADATQQNEAIASTSEVSEQNEPTTPPSADSIDDSVCWTVPRLAIG